jgi:hypothetical protein
MWIEYGSNKQLTKNFNESEFYSKSKDLREEGNKHFLYPNLVQSAQIIRDFVGSAVKITSSYRSELHNKTIKAANLSYHMISAALDLSMTTTALNKVRSEIINKGQLYHQLRSAGISGIIIYPTFIHIDCRHLTKQGKANPQHFNGSDEYGPVLLVDKSGANLLSNLKEVKKLFFLNEVGNNAETGTTLGQNEDGIVPFKEDIIKGGAILLGILFFLIYSLKK